MESPRRFPRSVTWGVISLVLLPAVLMALGVDLGVGDPDPDPLRRADQVLLGGFLHTLLEWAAVGIGVIGGLAVLAHYYVHRDWVTPLIGFTLIGSGLLDVVQVAAANRVIISVQGAGNFVQLTWWISRLFCAASLLAGGTFLLIRPTQAKVRRDVGLQAKSAMGAVLLLLLGAAVTLVFALASTTTLVSMEAGPGDLFTRPYELIPLGLFLLAGTIVLPRLRFMVPGLFSDALLISIIPHIAAHTYLLLGSVGAYDGPFFAARAMKILAYAVPVVAIVMNYVQAVGDEAKMRARARLAQDEATISRRRYRALARNLPNSAVFLFDSKLRASVAEGKALQWFHCRPEDFDHNSISDVLPESFFELAKPVFERALTGHRGSFEYTFDTRSFLVHAAPVTEEPGGISVAMALLLDITEQREAERALRLTQFSVDRAAVSIAWLDERGRFVYANETMSRYLGYPPKALLELAYFNVDSDVSEADFGAHWDRVKSETQFVREGHLRKQDGSLVPVEVTWRYLAYDRREYLAAFIHDISDRVVRVQLMADKEAAEQANMAKSQFLTNMSHELRTPLNSVIGFANVLLKNKGSNLRDKDMKYIQRIQSNGRHLLALINDALDLSKVEAGQMTMTIEAVNLETLLQEIVGEMAVQVRADAVDLKLEVSVANPIIETDIGKLRQIVINLLGNAVKFTHEGHITVRVLPEPAEPGMVRLEIEDTGIGIPEDKLETVFRPFQQADEQMDRQYGGTGLGLALVKTMAEVLDFRLECESQEGKGSTFKVVMRRERRRAGTKSSIRDTPSLGPDLIEVVSATGLPPEAERGPEPLVLVIDDNTDARVLLTHAIEEVGVRVVTASSGRDGLRMARELRPDMVILDIMMPDMDGREVLERIRSSPSIADVPVVVVSFVATEQRKHLANVHAVIDKPASREAIHQVVHDCLARDRMRLLVVDDDELIRQYIMTLLTSAGVQVRTAANGEAGLRVLRDYPADLIIVDLGMPVMDGFGFIGGVRADPDNEELPIVVITGRDLSETEQRFLDTEAFLVLHKGGEVGERLPEIIATASRSRGGATGVEIPAPDKDVLPESPRNPDPADTLPEGVERPPTE